MNYAQYMRKLASTRSNLIGYQNGQDASMVTYKNRAKAASVKTPVAVETSFSKIGGTVGNILEVQQQNSSPTNAVCASGYKGVSNSQLTTTYDGTTSVLRAGEHCAVCSDPPSSEPYTTTIPCGIFINPPQNAPGVTKCCTKDPGILFSDNKELVADQGRQQTLRQQYNLPSKLQGLRGPIITNR